MVTSFTASQTYRYRCDGGPTENIESHSIVREVEDNGDGTYNYRVSKGGNVGGLFPIVLP